MYIKCQPTRVCAVSTNYCENHQGISRSHVSKQLNDRAFLNPCSRKKCQYRTHTQQNDTVCELVCAGEDFSSDGVKANLPSCTNRNNVSEMPDESLKTFIHADGMSGLSISVFVCMCVCVCGGGVNVWVHACVRVCVFFLFFFFFLSVSVAILFTFHLKTLEIYHLETGDTFA